MTDPAVKLGPECPGCGEPWLRPTAVPGRYRCVYCLQRYELVSVCPDCGEHSTIVRMSSTAIVAVQPLSGQHARGGLTEPMPATPAPAVALTERRVAPSILSADFARLGAQVEEVLDAGARVIHVDVMDGHFVPPITFGAVVVSALADLVHDAGAIIDVHLMVERPERHVADIATAGADSITLHVEATPHVHYTLQAIREAGCRACAALCPATAVSLADVAAETPRHGPLHDASTRAGAPSRSSRTRWTSSPGCARLLPDTVALEVDGGIHDADRRPGRPGGRQPARRRLGGVQLRRPRGDVSAHRGGRRRALRRGPRSPPVRAGRPRRAARVSTAVGAEVADLDPRHLASGSSAVRRRRRTAPPPPARRAGRRRSAAGQGRLVERARDQVQAHPEADDRQPDATVVKALVAEEDRHHSRADRQQAEGDRRAEGGDHEDRGADRAMELVG